MLRSIDSSSANHFSPCIAVLKGDNSFDLFILDCSVSAYAYTVL